MFCMHTDIGTFGPARAVGNHLPTVGWREALGWIAKRGGSKCKQTEKGEEK